MEGCIFKQRVGSTVLEVTHAPEMSTPIWIHVTELTTGNTVHSFLHEETARDLVESLQTALDHCHSE